MKRTRSDDGLSPSPKKQKTSHHETSPVRNRVTADDSVHNYNSSQDENGLFLHIVFMFFKFLTVIFCRN